MPMERVLDPYPILKTNDDYASFLKVYSKMFCEEKLEWNLENATALFCKFYAELEKSNVKKYMIWVCNNQSHIDQDLDIMEKFGAHVVITPVAGKRQDLFATYCVKLREMMGELNDTLNPYQKFLDVITVKQSIIAQKIYNDASEKTVAYIRFYLKENYNSLLADCVPDHQQYEQEDASFLVELDETKLTAAQASPKRETNTSFFSEFVSFIEKSDDNQSSDIMEESRKRKRNTSFSSEFLSFLSKLDENRYNDDAEEPNKNKQEEVVVLKNLNSVTEPQ